MEAIIEPIDAPGNVNMNDIMGEGLYPFQYRGIVEPL